MFARLRFTLALSTVLSTSAPALSQQAYFKNYYSFGDSLSDTGRIARSTSDINSGGNGFFKTLVGGNVYDGNRASNAPNFLEVLPGLVGAPYVAANQFAIGSSTSAREPANAFVSPNFAYGFLDQVDQAVAQVGRFSSRDVLNIWAGYNDLSGIPAAGAAPQSVRLAGVNTIIANTVSGIETLASAGARNFVVFNQKTDRYDTLTYAGMAIPFGNRDLASAVNAQLPGALTPLSAAGLNVHLFDVDALITRLRANPTAYGYGPDANTPCAMVPNCRANGTLNGGAIENQYISPDGIHNTGRTNQYIAAFVANQLNAPLTIGPQGDLGQSAGLAFSSTLIDFLSAERRRNMAMSVPVTYTADLPGRTVPPVTVPVQVGSPLSLFALGTYLNVDRTAQNQKGGGSTGNTFSADFGGVTAGLLYQATPNLVLGAAFNYLNTSVDLRGPTNGRIDMDSFQGAGFASLSFPNFFADVVGTYGHNNYTLDRPGVMNDRLTASPSGDVFTVAARTGYLFDFGTFKAGPVGEMAYANVSVDAYRERGDALLTIGTRQQNLEGLTAGGGIQIRTTLPIFGGLASPFLNVTAQHDFLDGVRTVTSFQTYAPTLLIRTQTGRRSDDVYGRVAGGLDLDFGNGLSGVLTGSTSFARSGGDDHTVSVGLRYRF